MKAETRKLTRSALLAAAATVLVYISAYLPTGALALAAVAGLTGVLAVIHCGGKYACGVFAVSAALGLLLSPVRSGAALYALFLGYYPALKSLLERLHSLVLCWGAKLLIFNAASAAVFLLLWGVLTGGMTPEIPVWALWIAGNAVFIVYDIGLSRLIQVYIRNISGKMKK